MKYFSNFTLNVVLISFFLVVGSNGQTTFSNNEPIMIPDASGTNPGIAQPYPSVINVTGLNGTVTDVNVRIQGLTHTFPDDIGLLLVSPDGAKRMVIQSDVGGSGDVTNLTYTLDDQALATIPNTGPLVAGTYKPSSVGDDDLFPLTGAVPPPLSCQPAGTCPQSAPAGTATLNSQFSGINPNGNWKLYAVDCCALDQGAITGGWSITITVNSPTPTANQSATASIEHLAQIMDLYHDRFFNVYEDISSPGNHFLVPAKIPNGNAPVTIFGSSMTNPHSGATAIRNQFCTGGGTEGGFYFQNGIFTGMTGANPPPTPQTNFGTVPNAGIDLTGATRLTFWARGEIGGEKIEFFMGGVGRGNPPAPFPDSTSRIPAQGSPNSVFTLSANWQQFTIDLTGANLNYVLGGFGWYATIANNPNGAVFYLDDIRYEFNDARRTQRLNEPRFLRSYATLPFQFQPSPVGDFDSRFRNMADSYDNALALLAFLADGSEDSVRRAKLIGDAFVYASEHDRFFNDGRFRNAYAAGDLTLPPGWTVNSRIGTVAVPGFYTETQPVCLGSASTFGFTEVRQESIDTGNNAWVGIALLALYRRTSNPAYLTAAIRLGNFVQTFRNISGAYQGFQGGIINPESTNPTRRIYASSEHNLDVYAFFTELNRLTGQAQWQADAQHAQQFVETMWEIARGCYLTGTIDPSTRNSTPGQLPLDVQAWSILALPNTLSIHPQVLNCAEQNHRVTHHSFNGYDFNEDRDGVWFEGTAQMATAYALTSQQTIRENILQELRRAQQTPPNNGDMKGLVASCHEGVSTGFGFNYYLRLHIGATAWNVFAHKGVNPYYLVGRKAFDYDGDGKTDLSVFRPNTGVWWIQNSLDSNTRAYQFGQSADRIVPADYTGDGKTDMALFRDGTWFVLRSENFTFFAAPFGLATDIPAPGDFDADGKADLAVFRQTVGTWFIQRSTQGFVAIPWGANGDVPTVGDYDNDGQADVAIFRSSNGSWWVRRSRAGNLVVVFGNSTDKPAPADYTGDGKTDIAFFRPQNGNWFVLRSEDLSFYSAPFGANGDVPVVGDYDGDGRADLAVFRPTTATWFINRSTQGSLIQAFGQNGDRPTPAAFVP